MISPNKGGGIMDDGKRYTEYGLFGALAIGLAAGLLAGMAIYAAAYPAFQSQEWAAWVQAIGSVGAIAAAIALGQQQHSTGLKLQRAQAQLDRERREREESSEAERVLQAIKDEVSIRWAQFEMVIGNDLDKTIGAGDKMFAMYNRMPADLFPVYQALVDRLPLISDSDLRQKIVRGYAVMEGLVLTVETNSELAREYLRAVAANGIQRNAEGMNAKDIAERGLMDYFRTLVETKRAVQAEVQDLLQSLSDALDSH
jgi:hypothetical protein